MTNVKRSHSMLVAGYYLARCGERSSDGRPAHPPAALRVSTWQAAYDFFYDAMGDGRTAEKFRHSMNGTRSDFDSLFDNGREGSKREGTPVRQIHEEWGDRSDQDLEKFVLSLAKFNVPPLEARTEGEEKVFTSIRRERDPKLRDVALKLHGFNCMACGFNFEKSYGKIGKEFIEVHHVVPLSEAGKRETNPETDLVVLCSNCHSMVHRRHRSNGICLSVDELKEHIRR